MSKKINWKELPDKDNYEAATSYLGLIYSDKEVKQLVGKLCNTHITFFRAKDIFRASGLSLLGISNSHVTKFTKKVKKGNPISPILLVRDSVHGKVVVADGYHRMCAVYTFDEDCWIPSKIV